MSINWGSLLKALPAVLGLIAGIFARRKSPPLRADDILGKPSSPTDSQEAKDAADEAAKQKYLN